MRVYDLFCGLGGWSEGFLAEGYECIGFDIEAHRYPKRIWPERGGSKAMSSKDKHGNTLLNRAWEQNPDFRNAPYTGGWEEYPGTLILRDVRSIHGSELKDATCIVASPPCQAYSYRAMPWSRAKALPPPDNTLFLECFRIQRQAIEAAGHHIPLIVENVRGAQKWVGRAQWNYGSFYLWGDVPALMPPILSRRMKSPVSCSPRLLRKRETNSVTHNKGSKVPVYSDPPRRNGGKSAHLTSPGENLERLYADRDSAGIKQHGSGHVWFRTGNGALPSKSNARKAASAMIAKIPFTLSSHVARCYKPMNKPCGICEGWGTYRGTECQQCLGAGVLA